MKKLQLFSVALMIALLAIGCKEEETTVTPTPTAIHEATELVKYVESNNDYIYAASSFVISASSYRTEVVADPTKVYTIDIRTRFVLGR